MAARNILIKIIIIKTEIILSHIKRKCFKSLKLRTQNRLLKIVIKKKVKRKRKKNIKKRLFINIKSLFKQGVKQNNLNNLSTGNNKTSLVCSQQKFKKYKIFFGEIQ